MLWYVDLVEAKVYADRTNAQGDAFPRTDFSAAADPRQRAVRLLSLDGDRRRQRGE
jgi:hypothetical protein